MRSTVTGFLTRALSATWALAGVRRPARAPRRGLILKPCCAGDVVFATATLAALRRAYPQAHIAWAISAWARPILAHNPRVDALLDAGPLGTRRATLADVRALAARARAEDFDTCLVLDRSPLLTLVAWLARIPQRVGLDSGGRGFAHTLPVPAPGARHEAELYLDCARALGIDAQDAWPEFYPAPEDESFAAARVAEWAGPGPLVLLNPAGGTNPGMRLVEKRWPVDRYAALGARLAAERGARLALLAGPGDEPLLAELQARLHVRASALAVQWGQAGALARRAALYAGNDTGLTHVASASGTAVLAIFGPSDPRRYAPFAPPGRAVTLWRETAVPAAGVAGGVHGDFTWEQGVTVDEAVAAAEKLLDCAGQVDSTAVRGI